MGLNSKEAPSSVLNQRERETAKGIDATMRTVIPPAFFDKAREIVEAHRKDQPTHTVMSLGGHSTRGGADGEDGNSPLNLGHLIDEAVVRYVTDKFMTTRKLSHEYGGSREYWRNVLNNLGVIRDPGQQPGHKIKELPIQKLRKAYERKDEKHKGSTTLAKEEGVAHTTVLRQLRSDGVEILPKGGNMPLVLPEPDEVIAAQYMSGKPAAFLAKKNDTSVPTIIKHIEIFPWVEIRRRGPFKSPY